MTRSVHRRSFLNIDECVLFYIDGNGIQKKNVAGRFLFATERTTVAGYTKMCLYFRISFTTPGIPQHLFLLNYYLLTYLLTYIPARIPQHVFLPVTPVPCSSRHGNTCGEGVFSKALSHATS